MPEDPIINAPPPDLAWHTLAELRTAGLRLISEAQILVLLASGPKRQKALAASLDLTATGALERMDCLEADGLIATMRPEHDRRGREAILTEKGQRLANLILGGGGA